MITTLELGPAFRRCRITRLQKRSPFTQGDNRVFRTVFLYSARFTLFLLFFLSVSVSHSFSRQLTHTWIIRENIKINYVIYLGSLHKLLAGNEIVAEYPDFIISMLSVFVFLSFLLALSCSLFPIYSPL